MTPLALISFQLGGTALLLSSPFILFSLVLGEKAVNPKRNDTVAVFGIAAASSCFIVGGVFWIWGV